MPSASVNNALLVAALALAVPLGAAGVWLVWSTFNLWEDGAASAGRLAAAGAAAVALVLLVAALWRLLSRLAPPEE